MHVEAARQAAANGPRVVASDTAVAWPVGDWAGAGAVGGVPAARSRARAPSAATTWERAGADLAEELRRGGADGRHELDLRRPKLRLEVAVRQTLEHRLDRGQRLERARVDEDQLLQAERQRVRDGESSAIGAAFRLSFADQQNVPA